MTILIAHKIRRLKIKINQSGRNLSKKLAERNFLKLKILTKRINSSSIGKSPSPQEIQRTFRARQKIMTTILNAKISS